MISVHQAGDLPFLEAMHMPPNHLANRHELRIDQADSVHLDITASHEHFHVCVRISTVATIAS